MDINITFVIQGINFGICYLFLKYFFLKPAVQLLSDREAEYNKLLGDLEKDDLALQKKIAYRESLVEAFRTQAKAQFPVFQEVAIVETAKSVTYRQSDATTVSCQKTLKDLLVAKAMHGSS